MASWINCSTSSREFANRDHTGKVLERTLPRNSVLSQISRCRSLIALIFLQTRTAKNSFQRPDRHVFTRLTWHSDNHTLLRLQELAMTTFNFFTNANPSDSSIRIKSLTFNFHMISPLPATFPAEPHCRNTLHGERAGFRRCEGSLPRNASAVSGVTRR